jgi:putative ABC transport system permease protein
MKYLHYIFRNARRNPIRSMLTIASTSSCLFLMMILLSFFEINSEVNTSTRIYNRIATLNANGFAGMIPIAAVAEVARMPGVVAATPFNWIGGKYKEETVPFAQFGVDPDSIFKIMDEFIVPADQLKAFQENRDGCVIGRKLANDWNLKVGDSMPIKGDAYPVDLNLTVRGIYDGPTNRDLRMCLVRWDYFDESLKRVVMSSSAGGALAPASARVTGNAGMIFTKCKSADDMPKLCKQIDEAFRNSDFPTRTQTEEAFGKMFAEMMGDLQGMIRWIGIAVIISLLCVAGNAMAMSMRERTSEVAVLKAIGFGKTLILGMVLTEAVVVSGIGGVIGSLGSKFLCDIFDLSKYSGGFLPFFFVPWNVAGLGMAVALAIGLLSGILPAFRAANLSVIDGLRRVI